MGPAEGLIDGAGWTGVRGEVQPAVKLDSWHSLVGRSWTHRGYISTEPGVLAEGMENTFGNWNCSRLSLKDPGGPLVSHFDGQWKKWTEQDLSRSCCLEFGRTSRITQQPRYFRI